MIRFAKKPFDMAENKTRPNAQQVQGFLDGIEDPLKQQDCREIASLMEEITGSAPVMWGDSIVGFGDYHYKYASGREGDWFLTGFSPRKQNITLYIHGYLEEYQQILGKLGKFKHGKGCLYIKKLEDVDREVLKDLIRTSLKKNEKV